MNSALKTIGQAGKHRLHFPGRLANQLILVFGITIAFFMSALTGLWYYRTNQILILDYIRDTNNILVVISQNWQNYIAQLDELSVAFRKDELFMKALAASDSDVWQREYLENQLKIIFYSRNDLEALRFYHPGQARCYTISRFNDKLTAHQPVTNPTQEQWYRRTVRGEFFRYLEPASESPANPAATSQYLFHFNRALVSIPGWRVMGVVSFSLNRLRLDPMLRGTFNQAGEVLGIYDAQNRLFYCSDPRLAAAMEQVPVLKALRRPPGKNYGEFDFWGEKYLAIWNQSGADSWKILKLVPVDLLKKQTNELRNVSFGLGALMLGLLIGLTIVVAQRITYPLRRLAQQMIKVGEGDFKVQVEGGGSFEGVNLARRFNAMVEQINQLIRETYLAQINEKTARLKALEAQINPHFLYNTLQAISSYAAVGGVPEVSRMTEELAFCLRYCIKGGEAVALSREIQQIQKYLHIQQVRFAERLTVKLEVDQAGDEILIPKLALQTLVENAVQHALEDLIREIRIRIRVEVVAQQVMIEVADNGPGMSRERLEEVNAAMREDALGGSGEQGMGLKNLYSRLQLMYGEEAQLQLESVAGEGTRARMMIPIHFKQ